MPQEFEGDLTESEFWGADLSGSTFRDVNLTDTTITHAWLVNVTVDALVDSMVINGVDVTAYVNERDPWYPLRAQLQPTTPDDMIATASALEAEWATAVGIVQGLPDGAAGQSVNDEFSFVETLRHLVFAIDKWFVAPILDEGFHPFGMPNSGSVDHPWPSLQYDLTPSLDEVLDVRGDRSRRLASYLESITTDDLATTVDVLENGPHSVQQCLHTVFEEEFWHLRYARRDLAILSDRYR